MDRVDVQWFKKSKTYKTKYFDCLKELCRQVETAKDADFKNASSNVREQFKSAIQNLADK